MARATVSLPGRSEECDLFHVTVFLLVKEFAAFLLGLRSHIEEMNDAADDLLAAVIMELTSAVQTAQLVSSDNGLSS
ncbi:MAG: hypothetical protein AAGI10_14305 [Pseudomonadota bacterium]